MSFAQAVPPLQGGKGLFGICITRPFGPGCHMADFQSELNGRMKTYGFDKAESL
jgi:hypothetical protein